MSRIIAVALALAILAVPVMAQDQFPPEDIDVNITVEEMASLWHEDNLGSLDLVVSDAAPWYGRAVTMSMIGNTDFAVSIEADNTNMPQDVRLDVVTNADETKWMDWSRAADGDYRIYNSLWEDEYVDDFGTFKNGTDSYHFQTSAAGDVYDDGPIAETTFYTYTSGSSGEIESIANLLAVYSGWAVPPQVTEGAGTTVVFTITPQ